MTTVLTSRTLTFDLPVLFFVNQLQAQLRGFLSSSLFPRHVTWFGSRSNRLDVTLVNLSDFSRPLARSIVAPHVLILSFSLCHDFRECPVFGERLHESKNRLKMPECAVKCSVTSYFSFQVLPPTKKSVPELSLLPNSTQLTSRIILCPVFCMCVYLQLTKLRFRFVCLEGSVVWCLVYCRLDYFGIFCAKNVYSWRNLALLDDLMKGTVLQGVMLEI